MNKTNLKPERITKPIQLLAAWLVGLFSLDSTFLIAAVKFDATSWLSGALVIAAILNVPLFLIALFLLQTKFRPELQEDSYYSTYLSQKTNEPISLNKTEIILSEMRERLDAFEKSNKPVVQVSESKSSIFKSLVVGVNKHLRDSDSIKSKLADLEVLGCSSFGTEVAPDNRVVSISKYLPKEVVPEILDLARELRFENYRFFDDKLEETSEDVLFGSYGEPQFDIIKKSA